MMGVVSNFIVQALQNAPITVYGNGTQTRSFCYVDDLVDGILKFTEQDKEMAVNIGNPNEISMHELADTICKLTASKSHIKFMNLPQDDPVGEILMLENKKLSELGTTSGFGRWLKRNN